MGKSRRGVVLVVGAVLVVLSTALSAPSAGSAVGRGCAVSRVPVVYHSDGGGAGVAGDLVTCARHTGFGGAESHLRVAPNGDVVQEPGMLPLGLPSYMQSGLAVTRDHGGSWSLVQPAGTTFQPQDNALYIDRRSGRLYLVLSSGLGVDIAGETELLSSPASPAGYVHWSVTPLHGFVGSENSRFASAPAPAGQRGSSSGENVGYWCGNQNAGLVSPAILDRTCFRSFDGGASWQRASIPFANDVPQYPECGQDAAGYNAGDGSYPQGAADGSLWVLVECGGTTYLARSTDEATSFPILHKAQGGAPLTIPFAPAPASVPLEESVAGVGPHHELRVDSLGNLYAFELKGSAVLLRISRNHGLSWSAPLNMTAPSARHASIYQWQVAVGAAGQVALAYLATRQGVGWDGYITITGDVLRSDPVFYGSMINAANAPMVSAGGAGDDFIDVDIAPDGSAWAAFYADCPADGSDAFCAKSKTSPVPTNLQYNEQYGPQAEVIGRLALPQNHAASPKRPATRKSTTK